MSIPKGYKLVTVEPTVAMEDAAAHECYGYCSRCDERMQIKTGIQVDIYRAMLAASPAPPQPIYDEAKERELFEDYCAKVGLPVDTLPSGEYLIPATRFMSQGWHARAKAVEVGDE